MGHCLEIAIHWPWAGQHISLLRGKYSSALTVPFDLLTFKWEIKGGKKKKKAQEQHLGNAEKVNYSGFGCRGRHGGTNVSRVFVYKYVGFGSFRVNFIHSICFGLCFGFVLQRVFTAQRYFHFC